MTFDCRPWNGAAARRVLQAPLSTVSKSCTFGELDLAFSTSLELAWTTWGGHCDSPVSFFNGIVENGQEPFYNLGSYPIAASTDPKRPDSSEVAALMVRAASGARTDLPPVRAPIEYRELWNDRHSGADLDGTCWKPIAPVGYVALGAYFQQGHGKAPPKDDPSVMVCVRGDLATQVKLGSEIWADHGCGHGEGDLEVWWPTASTAELEDGMMCVTAGTFIASPSYRTPNGPFWALHLPAPVASIEVEASVPPMTSRTGRPQDLPPQVDHEVTVPFTAIDDPAKPTSWKLANSPFYRLKRWVGYTCLEFFNNETEATVTGRWQAVNGVSKTETEAFESKVGVTIGAEIGVGILGTGSKVTASITTGFGWTTSSARSQMTTEVFGFDYSVPPLHACTLWMLNYTFRVSREDKSNVLVELGFVPNGTSAMSEQFPLPKGPEELRATVRNAGSGEEIDGPEPAP